MKIFVILQSEEKKIQFGILTHKTIVNHKKIKPFFIRQKKKRKRNKNIHFKVQNFYTQKDNEFLLYLYI